MKTQYTPLFQSFTLNNGVEIKNRFVVAPMTHFASSEDGGFAKEEREFLKNRAEDFGMFIAAATLVSPCGKAFAGQPYSINDEDLNDLTERANVIKSQGAKAILQIHHGGKLGVKDLIPTGELVAPSDDAKSGARALTSEEIDNLIKAFAKATDLAIRAGFDGVEIHGANGYLIQQFYSAQHNQRDDKWGGSVEKRLAFPMAVVDAVIDVKNQHQKPDFIIGYRFSPEEPGENGITMVETFTLIDALVEKPLQYLHISLWDFYKNARRGADTTQPRMKLIHERINGKLPLIGVGNLFTADDVLNAHETGWAEFFALGKAVMLNPDFVTLITNGKESEIETFLDVNRADQYGIPSLLWGMCVEGGNWLPPIKDKEWQPVDV